MKRSLLTAVLCAAIAAPALANDSTAELAAGGLVLTRTDAIEMASEDLFVSQDEVRVRYRFVNTSGKDVTTRVAFPMPDIGGEDFLHRDTAIPDREAPANILDFSTLVDGQPVKMEVEQKAVVNGVDHSAWLTRRGIPLGVHLAGVDAKLAALSRADKAEAEKLGLVTPDELQPAWILKTTFHWEQTFPPGRPLAVEHRYRPAAGGSVGTMVGAPGFAGYPEWAETRDRYCIDTAFIAAVGRVKGKAEYPPFTETRIAYVLKTGGNWAKPIGDFRMVIDKGDPKNLVSFCASDVRKISPTRFEVRKTNWTPPRDLDVLILKPYPPSE